MGVSLGTKEGASLGTGDGSKVGAKVGMLDCANDLKYVGELVGASEGSVEGKLLALEGSDVGRTVGGVKV